MSRHNRERHEIRARFKAAFMAHKLAGAPKPKFSDYEVARLSKHGKQKLARRTS